MGWIHANFIKTIRPDLKVTFQDDAHVHAGIESYCIVYSSPPAYPSSWRATPASVPYRQTLTLLGQQPACYCRWELKDLAVSGSSVPLTAHKLYYIKTPSRFHFLPHKRHNNDALWLATYHMINGKLSTNQNAVEAEPKTTWRAVWNFSLFNNIKFSCISTMIC